MEFVHNFSPISLCLVSLNISSMTYMTLIIFTLECTQCLYIGANVWKMVIAKYIYIYIYIYIINTSVNSNHCRKVALYYNSDVWSTFEQDWIDNQIIAALWRLNSIISDRNKLSCSWEHNSNRRMKTAKTTPVAVVLQWIACRFIINFPHPQYTHSEGRVW